MWIGRGFIGRATKGGLSDVLFNPLLVLADVIMIMKVDQISRLKVDPRKRLLTFGDFVAGVYQTWGERRAKGIIQLALKMNMIEFRGTERLVIS
jgi:hypothetical protein